jgi:NAD(P)-dependent dehydrogenase (short-subunit alcohol dehydrogenase family)
VTWLNARGFDMRNVVITGAGSGLGRVVAELFSSAGDRVFACDVDEAAVRDLVASGTVSRVETVDVASRAQVDDFFRSVWSQCGHVHVLINNVGVAGPRQPLESVPPEQWAITMDANLNAAFWTAQQVLPAMKRERTGCILNVSTGSVRTLPVNRSPYNVSKAALEALTQSIAREAGPWNIRCNAVRPGLMDNDRLRRVLSRVAEQRGQTREVVEAEQLQYVSMRSKVSMREVADMLLFLASDAAKHVTGQIIAVDGDCHWEG